MASWGLTRIRTEDARGRTRITWNSCVSCTKHKRRAVLRGQIVNKCDVDDLVAAAVEAIEGDVTDHDMCMDLIQTIQEVFDQVVLPGPPPLSRGRPHVLRKLEALNIAKAESTGDTRQ